MDTKQDITGPDEISGEGNCFIKYEISGKVLRERQENREKKKS